MSQTADQKPPVPDRQHVEERRHDRLIEYVKHLTTLSTGGILLQVAFLEKLFPQPRWRALVVLSLLALAISVMASVAAYTMLLNDISEIEEENRQYVTNLMVVIWLGFLIGIISIGVFGIRNIIAP